MTRYLLFVDDSPDDCELAVYNLSQAGILCEYWMVQDEAGLTECLRRRVPDLILCDVSLPLWDCWRAWSTCCRLASQVPFGLYSGVVTVEDARLAVVRRLAGTAEKDRPAQLIDLVRRVVK